LFLFLLRLASCLALRFFAMAEQDGNAGSNGRINEYALVCIEMMLHLAGLPAQITKKQAAMGVAVVAILGGVFQAGTHLAYHQAPIDFTSECLLKVDQSDNITSDDCMSLFVEFTLRNRQDIPPMNMTPCHNLSALEGSSFDAFMNWSGIGVAMEVFTNWRSGKNITMPTSAERERAVTARIDNAARKRDVFLCRTENAPHFEEVTTLDWCLTGIVCPSRNCTNALWDLRVPGYREAVNAPYYQEALMYVNSKVDKASCAAKIREFLITKTGDSFVQELAWNTLPF